MTPRATSTTISTPHGRAGVLFGTALIIAAALFTATAPGSARAEEPPAPLRLLAKPKPPQPGKEVFVRSKPHVNVARPAALPHHGPSRLKIRPGRPGGPGSLTGKVPELADWYCGEGSGPGGYAECTKDLIASCNGTYVPPKTNGEHQTWGMCHEKS